MESLAAVAVLMALALVVAMGVSATRRRLGEAATELHRAVGGEVWAWVDGPDLRALIEVVGILDSVTPVCIELTGDYETMPFLTQKYVVDRTRLRIPLIDVVEISHDGRTVHVRP